MRRTLCTARCIANEALYETRIERLDEIRIHADLLRPDTVILARHAGHGDHEKLLEARVTPKSLRNFETINARHCQVEEEHPPAYRSSTSMQSNLGHNPIAAASTN